MMKVVKGKTQSPKVPVNHAEEAAVLAIKDPYTAQDGKLVGFRDMPENTENTDSTATETPNNPREIEMPTTYLSAYTEKAAAISFATKDERGSIAQLDQQRLSQSKALKNANDYIVNAELEFTKAQVKFLRTQLQHQAVKMAAIEADNAYESAQSIIEKGDMQLIGYMEALKSATIAGAGIDMKDVQSVTMKTGVLTVTLKVVEPTA